MPWLSPSLFSESASEEFEWENRDVASERNVMTTIFPFLCGNADIPNGRNVVFDGLQAIINSDVLAQPALYDGALPSDIDKLVIDDLGHFIVPSVANPQYPAVPNFFMEVKAPGEHAGNAKLRACYNGARGARAIHSLQTYQEDPFYDNNAYTITSVYDAGTGTLDLYTTHPTQPTSPDTSPEYHTFQIGSFVLTSDPDTFRRGVTAFRNARDFAQEIRDRFVEEANAKARALNTEISHLSTIG